MKAAAADAIRLLIVAALSLVVAACASFAPQPKPQSDPALADAAWKKHRRQLAAIRQFTIDGRAANGLGIKADLHWRQFADGHFEIRIAGPFGAGAVALSGTPSQVLIRTADGEETTRNPEAWLQQRAGWTLPIRGLRYWILGAPGPGSAADVELDDDGRLASMTQNNWTLHYTAYQDVAGLSLPQRLEASSGDLKLKILVDRWDELTPVADNSSQSR